MYSFTNHFSHSSLRHRIGMMNRRRSGQSAWGRYVVWAMLVGVMVLACRHRAEDREFVINRMSSNVPLTNANRQLAAEMDRHGMPWFCQSSLFNDEHAKVRTAVING